MAKVRLLKQLKVAIIRKHVKTLEKINFFVVNDILYFMIRDALQGCGYGNAVQKALEEKGVKVQYLDGDDILNVLCPKPTPPPPPPSK